jgi:hypothetical protein
LFLIAAILLIAPTVWVVFRIYHTPPYYLTSSKMYLHPPPPLPPPLRPAIDPNEIYAVLFLAAIYAPGLALLVIAIFSRRTTRSGTQRDSI